MPFPDSVPNKQCIKVASIILPLVGDLGKTFRRLWTGMHHTAYLVMVLLFLFSLSPFVLRMFCPCTVTTLSFCLLFYFRPLILLLPVRCMYLNYLPYRATISNRGKPNMKAWRVLRPSLLQNNSNDMRQHHIYAPPNTAFVCSNSYALSYNTII